MRSLVLATAACSLCAACGSTMPSSPSGEVGPSTHVLTLVVQGTGGGKIQATGLADCSAPCTTNVAAGTQLTLVAVPDGASVFGGWSGDCHGSGECKVVLDADRSVAATFAKAPPPGKHVLTVVKTGSGTVTSSPAGIDCGSACSATFDDGATIALRATPDSGWRLSGFSGACSGSSCTVALRSDARVEVTFEAVPPPPADECAGLGPDPVPPPSTWQQPPDANSMANTCQPGTSDGTGNLALGSQVASRSTVIRLLDARGNPLGRASGTDVTIIPQAEGYLLADNRFSDLRPVAAQLFAIAPSGAVVGQSDQRVAALVATEDPLGGATAVWFQGATGSGNRLESYDAKASLRWSVALPDGGAYPEALGTDRAGNTLVLFKNTHGNRSPWTLDGIWVDHDGNVGPAFDSLGRPPEKYLKYRLWPRVGSGLFLSTDAFETTAAKWERQFDARATEGQPPPDWLMSRNPKLHMARNGRAYAFLDDDRKDCSQRVEIVSPSGKSCGTAVFQIANGQCVPWSIDIGYDGTVIQQQTNSSRSCTWRYWPAFFH